MEEWILFLLIGLLSGTVGSLVGLGGGVVTVPSLLLIAALFPEFRHLTPQVVVGTSLIMIVVTALSSTLTYARQRRVDYRSGLLFFAASGPGAVTGAYLNRFFEPDSFYIAFGVFMILVSIVLTVGERGKGRSVKWSVTREFTDPDGTVHRYGYHRPTALAVSFLVGLVSSLFGIGGGALMMPVMVLLFRFPPHVATATSMFMILFSSIIGSLGHLVQGNVEWKAALFIAPGAWFGGRLGAWISSRLSSRGLLIALRLALLLVAVRMIWEGVS
ncbi:sulfite exporter TauE/SafE family protein [Planifilum fimeticola]